MFSIEKTKMKDTNLNYALNVVARWFVGLVFLFSSFVKGVDPMGTMFKVQDYMSSWQLFGMGFEWAYPLAGTLAVALICSEFTVGVLLITGALRRLTAWTLAAMMTFFTVTTLIDATTNLVNDCGCFGDAVKLTNWQTFWKNVALDVPTVWIFLTRNLRRKQRFERDVLITLFAMVAMVLFGLYNINNEPCIDFRSWKVGNQMIDLDENAEVKSYVTYVNKETGERDEFLSEELVKRMEDPAWEAQWEWESSRVEDPHEIKADGFSMLDMDMNDHAKELIGSEDYLLIATIHHLDKVNEDGLEGLEDAAEWAQEHGVQMVLLTSALAEEVQSFLYAYQMDDIDFYFADATAIETMARSNPGFLLLKRGKVLGKWHYRNVDDLEDFILKY